MSARQRFGRHLSLITSVSILAGTIGNSIIILVLVAFFLVGREDLSRRALLFFQEHEIFVNATVLSEMSDRVSRYLLAELSGDQ